MKAAQYIPTERRAKQYVAYYRVSTAEQGASGLGLLAQKTAVHAFARDGEIVREFTETASGRDDTRPQLMLALRECRLRKACLIVQKLDRFSRSSLFVEQLFASDTDIVCVEMPDVDKFVLRMMSNVAQLEAEMISKRTIVALAAKKAQGFKLGGPYRFNADQITKGRAVSAAVRVAKARERAREIMPIVEELMSEGMRSHRALALGLTQRGIATVNGNDWHRSTVRTLLINAGSE